MLDLGNNKIFDLSPLAKLEKLEILRLSQNKINDITPILSLPNLIVLELWENELNQDAIVSIEKLNERQVHVD